METCIKNKLFFFSQNLRATYIYIAYFYVRFRIRKVGNYKKRTKIYEKEKEIECGIIIMIIKKNEKTNETRVQRERERERVQQKRKLGQKKNIHLFSWTILSLNLHNQ